MAQAIKIDNTVRITLQAGGDDVVFICRRPSGTEQSKFLNARFPSKRNKVTNRLYEARVEFIDSILEDVENVTYQTLTGESVPLNRSVTLTPEEKSHFGSMLGQKVESWKDLIPLQWKSSAAMYFEDAAGAGEEGN